MGSALTPDLRSRFTWPRPGYEASTTKLSRTPALATNRARIRDDIGREGVLTSEREHSRVHCGGVHIESHGGSRAWTGRGRL